MVGHAPLEGGIMVRVHVPQILKIKAAPAVVLIFSYLRHGLEQVRNETGFEAEAEKRSRVPPMCLRHVGADRGNELFGYLAK